ncbi:MAG: hypothetical protein K0R67_3734 [Paenibacillus sp.]|nr:hypothetical protein [Paenibacillus sp.]
MGEDKRQESSELLVQVQDNGAVSRRKVLATLGMAGIALASTGLVNVSNAYADSPEGRHKVKDLMNMDYVIATTAAELRANTSPDADLVYFVRDPALEGHFYYDSTDTTSADNGQSVLVSTSGARFKRIADGPINQDWLRSSLNEDGLYEYARVKPVPPTGQLANEAEVIIPYKGALYCLFKGSYSGSDNSYITVVRPVGDDTLKVTSTMNIGVGADARAMAIYNDDVFVFTNNKIKVYRIIDTALQLKLEYTRKSDGFVQTCSIINGRIYAPNWGYGKIDRFDLVNGVPSNETQFSIGAVGNASIVSSGNIHYLITWAATNNLTRLDIDENGDVYNRGVFNIPGIYRPRYGTIYNGILTVGGYSTLYAKTVAMDISSGTPVKIGEYINMPSHVRVGDYLIGSAADQSTPAYSAMYWKLVKVRISDGAVEVLDDRGMLYPKRYQSMVYGFLLGEDGIQPGASPADGQIGQEVVCYSTKAIEDGIQLPQEADDYKKTNSLRYSGLKSYTSGEVIARFKSFTPAVLGHLKVKLSYTIINNQNIPGDSIVAESVYAAFKSSAGTWSMTIPKVDVIKVGALAVTLDFQVSGADAFVSVSGALTNAMVNLTIDFDLSSNNMGAFYII